MPDKVKVLVVGLGNMGASHASAYHRNPGFEIVGLMSRSIKRKKIPDELQGLSALRGFRPGAEGDQARRRFDQHLAEHPCRIRDRRRSTPAAHVFMEKPIATNIEDAEKVVAAARAKNRKLVLGYILRVHPSWMKFIELGKTLGKPLVMRLNLNQQSSGPAWNWHKNLIDSLIPIVDCGVHYVDVMCQLTGAKPVRVHGIGAKLWAEADKQNYGHLHVTFDDGSVGWYEAGWGPMMSEAAYLREGRGRPEGRGLDRAGQSERQGPRPTDVSDSADIDQPHQDRRDQDPPCRGRRRTRTSSSRTRSSRMDGRARPPGALRPRAGVLPQGHPRGSRPDRVDGRGGQQPAHRAGRRAVHQRKAGGRARLRPVICPRPIATAAGSARPPRARHINWRRADDRSGSRSRASTSSSKAAG